MTSMRQFKSAANAVVNKNKEADLARNEEAFKREDGTKMGVVLKRGFLKAAWEVFQEVALGTDTKPNVTAREAKLLCHLNTENAMQFHWLQFLVWRRYLMSGALFISLVILSVTVIDFLHVEAKLADTLARCKEGSSLEFERTENLTVGREEVIHEVALPFPASTPVVRFKCRDPTELAQKPGDNSGACAERVEMQTTYGNSFGRCNWFPFSPWMKNKPPDRVEPKGSTTANPFAAFESEEVGFLEKFNDAGCSVNSVQYSQPQACVCGLSFQVSAGALALHSLHLCACVVFACFLYVLHAFIDVCLDVCDAAFY